MTDDKILLSILVPTYNREQYLKKALTTFFEQITDNIKNKIEIIVSDNCSNDKTQDLLKSFDEVAKLKGINFHFSKNNKNLGADRNFIKLIRESNAKFCWIFGDDEFLLDGGLIKILDILENNINIGLLHISNLNSNKKEKKYRRDENQKYIKKIGYMLTFITANIFNKEYISEEIDSSRFIGCNLIQELFYFQAILKSEENIFVYDKIFVTDRADNIANYKFYETFGRNQNNIFNFFKNKGLKNSTIDCINKRMLREFFSINIVNLNKKNQWEHENVYIEMKSIFSKYLQFWIFCYPLIKSPNVIKEIYIIGIRIFNKIMRIIGG